MSLESLISAFTTTLAASNIFLAEQAKTKAQSRLISFDVEGPTTQCRIRLVPPRECYASWAVLGFQPDSGTRPFTAPVLLGKPLTVALPYDHYEVLALFLQKKVNRAHRPRLLAIGSTYATIAPGEARVRIDGETAFHDNTEHLQSTPGADKLPITWPAPPPIDPIRRENHLGYDPPQKALTALPFLAVQGCAGRLRYPLVTCGGSGLPKVWGQHRYCQNHYEYMIKSLSPLNTADSQDTDRQGEDTDRA